MSEKASRLFLSFWDVCLDNLPVGRFERRALTAEDAGLLISTARKDDALCCVSEDDLLAPYGRKKRRDHDALRMVLRQTYGIELDIEDFLSKFDGQEGALQTIMPLQLARLNPGDRLLVVTCNYALSPGKTTGDLEALFVVSEDSVRFELIEALRAD